ncbi:MAG TPA: hypothetical protein VMC09_05825 [Anaerolineales bacterium]|nr:hypothetical protein [Anaerolineales bacterium]
MTSFAVQYLGSRPKDITPQQARERLRIACDRLPISMVLLDWDLPLEVEEAVAKEANALNVRLYRWQTWLTGDSRTPVPPEWAVLGLDGRPVPGHAGNPDFTFFCPNRPGVQDFLAKRLEGIAALGYFQGIFLDRIRFPSPAVDPASHLGCFCKSCTRKAAETGLDLNLVRRYIDSLITDADGARHFVSSLLGRPETPAILLEAFLDFREQNITDVIETTTHQADELRLSVGLDCFSPALTRMVGQDLTELDRHCDWIKLMIYPRVFGPAGISFELLGLTNWLIERGLTESKALKCLRDGSGLPVPTKKSELAKAGLGSETLALEIQRGRRKGITDLLAGVALVKVKTIHESSPKQIQEDLKACRAADGLVLSWDLWQIPLETIDAIHRIWDKP